MQVKVRLQAGQAGVAATADSIAQLETLQQLFVARDGRLLSTLAQKMAAAGQCTVLLCSANQAHQEADDRPPHAFTGGCLCAALTQLP